MAPSLGYGRGCIVPSAAWRGHAAKILGEHAPGRERGGDVARGAFCGIFGRPLLLLAGLQFAIKDGRLGCHLRHLALWSLSFRPEIATSDG